MRHSEQQASSSSQTQITSVIPVLRYSSLVDKTIRLDENPLLMRKNLANIKAFFGHITKHKRNLKTLNNFIQDMEEKSGELSISQKQSLLFLIVATAIENKDDKKIGLQKDNSERTFFDLSSKKEFKAYRLNSQAYIFQQNQKRTLTLLKQLRSSDNQQVSNAIELFKQDPNAYYFNPSSEFVSFKINVLKKNNKIPSSISITQIPQITALKEKIKNTTAIDADEIIIAIYNQNRQHPITEKILGRYSVELEDLTSYLLNSCNILATIKKDPVILELISHFLDNKIKLRPWDLEGDIKYNLLQISELLTHYVNDNPSISSYQQRIISNLRKRIISDFMPLEQIAGNKSLDHSRIRELSSTPTNRLNYDEAFAEFDVDYSPLRQEISRQFRRQFKRKVYEYDMRRDTDGIRRSDNVSPDHTLVNYTPYYEAPSPYYDASFMPLNNESYLGCHAPYSEKSINRYYTMIFDKEIKTVSNLSMPNEKSNHMLQWFVDESCQKKQFTEGNKTITIQWQGKSKVDIEELATIEQITADSILITETITDTKGKQTERSRAINYVQLKGWEDHGLVPAKVMQQFVEVTTQLNSNKHGEQKGPLLGHCHGGVGRWGTSQLSLHYYKQHIKSKKRYLAFIKQTQQASSNTELETILKSMAHSLKDQAINQANSLINEDERKQSKDRTEIKYKQRLEEITNASGSKEQLNQLANKLLEQFNPLNLTYPIMEDLSRLRLHRDSVQGAEQLATVLNFICHLNDEFRNEIGIKVNAKAQQEMKKGEQFTQVINSNRLAVLWKNKGMFKYLSIPDQLDQDPRKNRNMRTKMGEQKINAVLWNKLDSHSKSIKLFDTTLQDELNHVKHSTKMDNEVEINQKLNPIIASFKGANQYIANELLLTKRDMLLARQYTVATGKANRQVDSQTLQDKADFHLSNYNSRITKLKGLLQQQPANLWINNITNRLCKSHAAYNQFICAMVETGISYLELDAALRHHLNQTHLQPGVLLGRYLFHGRLAELVLTLEHIDKPLLDKITSSKAFGKICITGVIQAHNRFAPGRHELLAIDDGQDEFISKLNAVICKKINTIIDNKHRQFLSNFTAKQVEKVKNQTAKPMKKSIVTQEKINPYNKGKTSSSFSNHAVLFQSSSPNQAASSSNCPTPCAR